MDENKRKLTQKGYFRNIILIVIPTIISAGGVIISLNAELEDKQRQGLIVVTIVLVLILIGFVIFFSHQDEKMFDELVMLKDENRKLITILAYGGGKNE